MSNLRIEIFAGRQPKDIRRAVLRVAGYGPPLDSAWNTDIVNTD